MLILFHPPVAKRPVPHPPLTLNSLCITHPIILPPMAGVTNYPFRRLCRQYGAALYISEMANASSIIAGTTRVKFGPDELRSAQIYATDADEAAEAARVLIERDRVQHIDLNFGCPVKKVLKKGGGAALPTNEKLLHDICAGVVDVARRVDVPVTAKMRAGVDGNSLTYLRAGRIVQDAGVSAVILHARTAEDMYSEGSGQANWGRIGELVEALDIPVVGNGDVFTAADAVEMVMKTGAGGVAVGRGCLGRPWLFADLKRAFGGGGVAVTVPDFEEVKRVLMVHLRWGVEWGLGIAEMRKWIKWYLRGYGVDEVVLKMALGGRCLEEVEEVLQGVGGRVCLREALGVRGKG